MRPRLRPGAHLLRRRDDRWQVGLDPARRLVLPRSGPTPSAPPERLPDEAVFRAALPAPGGGPPPVRAAVAALARDAGDRTADVLERRSSVVVHVKTFGAPGRERLADELLDLGARAGLRLPPPRASWPAVRAGGRAPTRIVAVVGIGEPARELLDDHLRAHTPHLLLRLVEGRAVVGPLVDPGRTPCLRCLDAHATDADPSWPLLVAQYARAVRVDRDDGVPEPVDAALATLAVAWAARDLATYAEGGTPTTLASTVELGPRLETVETRHWSPHPRCGCSWR